VKDKYPKPTSDEIDPASGNVEKLARNWYDTNIAIQHHKKNLSLYTSRLRECIGEKSGVKGPKAQNGKPEFTLTWKLEKKTHTSRSSILEELGVTKQSEIFKRHTKTTYTRVLRKNWNYEEKKKEK
jgi:hypothetical protein